MQNDCKCNCNKISADDKRFVELKEYIDSLNGAQGVTMSVLQEAQRIFGYLPLEVQKFISDEINVPIAEIYGVSTFYSQFNLTPKGKHKIGICLGTACYVKGAQAVIDEVAKPSETGRAFTTLPVGNGRPNVKRWINGMPSFGFDRFLMLSYGGSGPAAREKIGQMIQQNRRFSKTDAANTLSGPIKLSRLNCKLSGPLL